MSQTARGLREVCGWGTVAPASGDTRDEPRVWHLGDRGVPAISLWEVAFAPPAPGPSGQASSDRQPHRTDRWAEETGVTRKRLLIFVLSFTESSLLLDTSSRSRCKLRR